MSNFQTIAEIKQEAVRRIPCGIAELNWLYGCSKAPGYKPAWGIPVGKLSLWSGAAGVGKSRAAIELAKSLANNGYKVLYFQSEMDLSTFSNWVKKEDISNPKNFLVSNVKSLSEMLTIIQQAKPNVVFIDSINMVNEFENGTSRNIKSIIEGDNGHRGFRDICKKFRVHAIFLGQLNKDSKVKGSSTLPHLVDTVFNIEPLGIDGYFVIRVGSKHRYGRTGKEYVTYWEHLPDGVRCDSEHRLEDHLWCETHGVPVQPIFGLVNPSIPSVESTNISHHNIHERGRSYFLPSLAAFFLGSWFAGRNDI